MYKEDRYELCRDEQRCEWRGVSQEKPILAYFNGDGVDNYIKFLSVEPIDNRVAVRLIGGLHGENVPFDLTFSAYTPVDANRYYLMGWTCGWHNRVTDSQKTGTWDILVYRNNDIYDLYIAGGNDHWVAITAFVKKLRGNIIFAPEEYSTISTPVGNQILSLDTQINNGIVSNLTSRIK